MALGHTLLKSQTVLQQLLEEINFQRTKEMRQLLKDDGGFVVLQGTTYWTDLFVRHFLFQSEPDHSIDSDDLLFFVRKKHVKGTSRQMPKYDTEVNVFRKDSRKLPIGDPDVDWEETVYLNLIIHQFNYTLTLAICTRTSPKELQVLRRHSQRVYASPSRRKMDTKGDGEEMTYPHICFMVDNFDEVFSDIMVRDGEMVCVELVANDRDGSVQGVIFLGSIRYDALKKVYDARQSSLSSKVAQRMTFGFFNSPGPQTRCEFVRMKGPQGKGHAEMAVTKPKGSGIETPTSEPGFCATDMWDEWDEDPDDYYNTRHQRRLSDPSANLNNFSRYGWKSKSCTGDANTAGAKARSENEGLDSLASEVSEIEGGDLRDDRPASSASDTKLATKTTTCCNCFGPKKRWSDSASGQMSDVYCRACDDDNDFDSPACLANITPKRGKPKHRNLLTIESELEIPNITDSKKERKIAPREKNNENRKSVKENCMNNKNNNKKIEEYEVAQLATAFDDDDDGFAVDIVKIGVLNEYESELMIRVQGKEELPATQTTNTSGNATPGKYSSVDNCSNHPLDSNRILDNLVDNTNMAIKRRTKSQNQQPKSELSVDDCNGNDGRLDRFNRAYSTLPKMKNKQSVPNLRPLRKVPMRTTPDGTNIYYWCDVPKKTLKELDDGAYNPLWATRGFTQTFHFWKEHRRQQSTPLNAFLTYVTLPWWSIAKDLLDHRETPILTF
ncbi:hypothetical protein Bhyg_05230 [Pseudolycoriella hygida]|uniref:Uncharacterized protein n=1 Tax=Pseudolycoriella hygida TaxID=35572 RepID=A0A9Q0S975_9DIPT|nr:hypothetical protein Bhyg_05230 [Pseudolycoriella hygida]